MLPGMDGSKHPSVAQDSNAFEEKRQKRVARLQERAAKKAAQAHRLLHKHDALLGVMNGTPIVVGHHSERRHRRDLARIQRDTTAGFEAQREAQALAYRAEAAARNEAISSDDPNALEKLRAKLAELDANSERLGAELKVARKAIRGMDKTAARVELLKLNLDAKLFGFFDAMGFLPTLANASSERARLKARIAKLEEAATAAPQSTEINGVRIFEEENRTRMQFPAKPSPAQIAKLKSHGFRWSPSAGTWQRHASSLAFQLATQIASQS